MSKKEYKEIMKLKGIITPEQLEWLKKYQDTTGFEPMFLDELASGEITFNKCADDNNQWYETHTSDNLLSITDNIPYDYEEYFEKLKGDKK